MCSSPAAVTWTSDIVPVFSKELLEIYATREYEFTLKRVRDMTRTCSSMQLYPSQSRAKVLVKPQKKPFDTKKTTNTGIGYDRRLAICQHTFCPMVLEKLFVALQ